MARSGAKRALELTGRPRRRLIAQVRLEEPNCWLCGLPIDLLLPATDAMSSTVDEIVPRSLAPDRRTAALDRTNCRHAHRRCNSSRGNGTRKPKGRSRRW